MNKFDLVWLDNYKNFINFIKVNSRVPGNKDNWGIINIGTWYRNQIISYRKGKLNKERLYLLNNVYPFWFIPKDFNNYLITTNWKSFVTKGETPIDILFSGESLDMYVKRSIYSIEELYRVGLMSKNIAFCTLSFEFMFPNMKFYEARIIADMFKDEDFLKLENLKSFLRMDIQKSIHKEIEFAISRLSDNRFSIINLKYMLGKSNKEIATMKDCSIVSIRNLVIGSLRRIKFSTRLSDIYYKGFVPSINSPSTSYKGILKTLSDNKDILLSCSEKYYIENIKPILSNLLIENMGLSHRSELCLLKSNLTTADNLLYCSNGDLLSSRNIGKGCVIEINEKINPLKDILFKNENIVNLYRKK